MDHNHTPKTVLTIAGFDGSSGAGLTADLKTFAACHTYGISAMTALTVQNTQSVANVVPIAPEVISEQITHLASDFSIAAIKLGMLFNEAIIHAIANALTPFVGKIPIVVDPVMIAQSGDSLLESSAQHALKAKILPLASVITPNIPEAAALTGIPISNEISQDYVAQALLEYTPAVIIKGGHRNAPTKTDTLYQTNNAPITYSSPTTLTKNTHGTGCTFAAALAAFLAQGYPLALSFKQAKEYITHAIQSAFLWELSHGHGPVNHFHHLNHVPHP